MTGRSILIALIDIAVGASVLAVYMRRDRGIIPSDRLPDGLGEALDGRTSADAAKLAPRP